MRDLTNLPETVQRIQMPPSLHSPDDDPKTNGAFIIDSEYGGVLRVIASVGYGWDHVSVSLINRVPNYYEMKRVKKLFFKPDEVAMELHVSETEHINCHFYCLHLWRPTHQTIPLPPSWLVGGMSPKEALRQAEKIDFVTGLPKCSTSD